MNALDLTILIALVLMFIAIAIGLVWRIRKGDLSGEHLAGLSVDTLVNILVWVVLVMLLSGIAWLAVKAWGLLFD